MRDETPGRRLGFPPSGDSPKRPSELVEAESRPTASSALSGERRINASYLLHCSRETVLGERHTSTLIQLKFFLKMFDVTFEILYTSHPLMQTCMNISNVIWPTMSVPMAIGTRHSRLSQGCVFSLGLSRAYPGASLETNLDKPEVSR